jgi:hypothetical protein
MFKKKEITTPEEKLLKIIEEPRERQKASPAFAHKQKKLFKISFKGLKKINFLDLTNRLLLGAGGVATVFLIFTIVKPIERPGLAIIPREDISLLNTKADEALKTKLDSYLNTVLKRNIFEVVERGEKLAVSIEEELDLKLVGIISLGEGMRQGIIEDKDARTYLVNEGDMILEQLLIEKIESDKVIIKKGEERVELK